MPKVYRGIFDLFLRVILGFRTTKWVKNPRREVELFHFLGKTEILASINKETLKKKI